MAHRLSFTVQVYRNELPDWMSGMSDGDIAILLRNTLENGGFCYSATVEPD